jgi:hypothetical protein
VANQLRNPHELARELALNPLKVGPEVAHA